MRVVRELSKLIMFTVIWAMPLITAKMFGSNYYLWLLVVSFICTIMLFTHFEDIEESEVTKKVITKLALDIHKTKAEVNETA